MYEQIFIVCTYVRTCGLWCVCSVQPCVQNPQSCGTFVPVVADLRMPYLKIVWEKVRSSERGELMFLEWTYLD